MAYVDLNPIRARMASTPEQSKHTSIRKRLYQTAEQSSLESFVGIQEHVIGIPFRLKDYIELVDWTGRIIRDDKRGYIEKTQPKILDRLSMNAENWQSLTTQFEEHFQSWVSSEHISRALSKTVQSVRITPLRIHKE